MCYESDRVRSRSDSFIQCTKVKQKNIYASIDVELLIDITLLGII